VNKGYEYSYYDTDDRCHYGDDHRIFETFEENLVTAVPYEGFDESLFKSFKQCYSPMRPLSRFSSSSYFCLLLLLLRMHTRSYRLALTLSIYYKHIIILIPVKRPH
jgi:hypothetical protein